jgi:hypothetical protein
MGMKTVSNNGIMLSLRSDLRLEGILVRAREDGQVCMRGHAVDVGMQGRAHFRLAWIFGNVMPEVCHHPGLRMGS